MAVQFVGVDVLWILAVPLVATMASLKGDSRIINGTEAVVENTRHQVSLRMKSLETIFGTGHICGASLITPTIALSAAHCFYDEYEEKFNSARDYFVVMGTLNRFEKTENTISFDITHYLHPGFDKATFANDLSLIFLDGTVALINPAVSIIPINREEIPAGTICQVTGWGVTELNYASDVLMTLDVPIIDKANCSINYGIGSIIDGMICAGYMKGEKDACQGDSGGPMVCNRTLVGVVSFGDGCARPGYPGVYADIRYYVDWIEKNMKSGAEMASVNGVVYLLGVILFHTFVVFRANIITMF